MRRSTAAALLAILFMSIFTRLLPLTRFLYWGSDIGEYHRLVSSLASAGHLDTAYNGWGTTYPYFPGFYFVVGGASYAGLDVDFALNVVPPILNAVSILLIFLIAVRLFRDERVGLMAAGVLAVSMPFLYTNSHPIPSALGCVFVLAVLTLIVGPSRGWSKFAALAILAVTLVLTHHLSTYFLVVMVIMGMVLKSLLTKGFRWRSIASDAAFLAVLLGLALPYWLVYATPFRVNILGDLGTMPWWGPFVAFVLAIAGWVALVESRKRWRWGFVPRYPTLKRSSSMLAIALVFAFAIAAIFTVVNVLGTTIRIQPIDVLYVSPFLVMVAFSASGRKLLDFAKDGHKPTAWFIGLTASLFVGSVIGWRILVPYRHIDYLLMPVAVMIGAGLAFLYDLTLAGRKGGLTVAGMAGLLILANMAVAYPPQDIMAGYNEGASAQSLVAIDWLPGHVTGLLATDHKASTLVFGFGNTNATWDTARQTLFAANFSEARDEMLLVNAPSGSAKVGFVLVNVDVRTGTQMFPWEPALPLSPQAQSKFDGVPYQRLYDDGYTQVYFVNWGL